MNASTISESIRVRAQRNHTAILKGLAQVSQARAAELIGTSETTVSRFKDSGIEQAAALIAACGLKVVDQAMQCYSPNYVLALKTLAGVGLDAPEPKGLEWE